MIGANLYNGHSGNLLRPIIIFISCPLPLRVRHALASIQLHQVARDLSLTHTHYFFQLIEFTQNTNCFIMLNTLTTNQIKINKKKMGGKT